MIDREEVIEYNREVKEFLSDLWNEIPQGRRKQYIKDPLKKALLDRYGIVYE